MKDMLTAVYQGSRTVCARLLQFMVHKCHGSATEESSMRAYLLSLGVALVLGLPGFAQQSNEPSAVERLLVTLQTGNEAAKRQAIEEISKLGPKAKDAVPALME